MLLDDVDKSAVDRARYRDFLGYGFWLAAGGRIKRRMASKALEAMKEKVREITERNRGRRIPTVIEEMRGDLTGWKEYFKPVDTPNYRRPQS